MSHRIEPAADQTSTFMLREGLHAPGPVTSSADAVTLPQKYGAALLEFLVVDPVFVFVSWEVSEEQLEAARLAFGAAFDSRRLVLTFIDAESGETLAERGLYGEAGRWFVELNQPGSWVSSRLEFEAGQQRLELLSTAALVVPRDREVPSASFEELSVDYGQDAQGRLTIAGTRLNLPLWPAVDLSGLSRSAADWDTAGGSSVLGIPLRPLLPGRDPQSDDSDVGAPG